MSSYLLQTRTNLHGKSRQLFFDGWASPTGVQYIGILLSWMQDGIQRAAFAKTMSLPQSHTSPNILSVIKVAVEEELGIPFHQIVSVVTDGGSTMVGAVNLDEKLSAFYIYCILHNFMRVLAIVDSKKSMQIY